MIIVVGSGVHGTFLQMSLVRDLGVPPHKIKTIDPWEQPLHLWDRRTFNCGMPYLRSPASHGMDRDFRTIRRLHPSEQGFASPYHRPARTLFRQHADELMNKYLRGTVRVQDTVASIECGIVRERQSSPTYVLITATGRHSAQYVILAPGSPAPLCPPDLGPYDFDLVQHVYDPAFNPQSIRDGERVLIIGAGIGGAQLACRLARRCSVQVWCDRMPSCVQFDSDPCYIGPRCGSEFSQIDDYGERRRLIARERRPGSLPRDVAISLRNEVTAGSVAFHVERVASVTAIADPAPLSVRGARGTITTVDRMILATGFEPGPPAPDLIGSAAVALGAPLAPDGYPIPSADLEWAPGLFLSGALAELEIGPPARNIIGAHLARRRIIPRIARLFSQDR